MIAEPGTERRSALVRPPNIEEQTPRYFARCKDLFGSLLKRAVDERVIHVGSNPAGGGPGELLDLYQRLGQGEQSGKRLDFHVDVPADQRLLASSASRVRLRLQACVVTPADSDKPADVRHQYDLTAYTPGPTHAADFNHEPRYGIDNIRSRLLLRDYGPVGRHIKLATCELLASGLPAFSEVCTPLTDSQTLEYAYYNHGLPVLERHEQFQLEALGGPAFALLQMNRSLGALSMAAEQDHRHPLGVY